jgi:hypothetical protein
LRTRTNSTTPSSPLASRVTGKCVLFYT